MDANDDVRNGSVSKLLKEVGMMEGVIAHHKTANVPATCSKNRSRMPIDTMRISTGVEILQCGFLPFHNYLGFNSDQQLVWVEIDNTPIFGHYPQQMWMAPSKRVGSNDPRWWDRYLERVTQQCEEENIFVQCEALRQLCINRNKEEAVGLTIEALHAELKEKTIRIRKKVDNKLLKFHAGAILWLPAMPKYQDRVEYWHRILGIKTDELTIRTSIKRLSIKIGKYSGHYVSTAEAIVKLKESI
jgi:hypothetical protein